MDLLRKREETFWIWETLMSHKLNDIALHDFSKVPQIDYTEACYNTYCSVGIKKELWASSIFVSICNVTARNIFFILPQHKISPQVQMLYCLCPMTSQIAWNIFHFERSHCNSIFPLWGCVGVGWKGRHWENWNRIISCRFERLHSWPVGIATQFHSVVSSDARSLGTLLTRNSTTQKSELSKFIPP